MLNHLRAIRDLLEITAENDPRFQHKVLEVVRTGLDLFLESNDKIQPNPVVLDQERHGTNTDYQRGCRCDLCRKAASEYGRKYRAKKKESKQILDSPTPRIKPRKSRRNRSHTLTDYQAGCRCETCLGFKATEEDRRKELLIHAMQ